MNKLNTFLISLLCVAVSCVAGDERLFFGFDVSDNTPSWKGMDITAGVASYQEEPWNHWKRPDADHTFKPLGATFIQLPMMIKGNTRINFGAIIPFSEFRRTRPEFSVTYRFGEMLDTPTWLPVDAGVYYGMSPWQPWGFMVSLIHYEF